ncbi:hypothetical protein ABPG75_004507 [Micractinium tetrahymenae]
MAGGSLILLIAALSLSGGVFADSGGPALKSRSFLPSESKAVDDGELTAGAFIGHSFRIDATEPSKVYCGSWDAASQDWVNNTDLGRFRGSGPTKPAESEYAGVADQLCAAGAAGGPTLVSAFQADGSDARNALAAVVWGSCSDPNAVGIAWDAFFNSSDISDSAKVLPIAENFVKAAEELGIAACVTVITVDSNNDIVDSETFHPEAGSGGSPCPSPGSGGGDEPLPDGKIRFVVTVGGRGAQCQDYALNSPDTWVNDTGPLYTGTGSESPDALDVQEFAQDMCDASKAADAVLNALDCGGSQARVAVAALLSDACNKQTASDAAFQAFIKSAEMNDPSTVLDYMDHFVDACDSLGAGCCFSLVVLDPSTNEVLDSRQIHTSGGGGSPAPAQSPQPATASSPPASPLPSSPAPPSGGGATLEQCKAQLGSASSGCTGTIAPGSACCNAVLALGSECLSLLAAAASQPGADPVTAVAVCDASSLSPGTSCCNGIQALGGACLGEVTAAAASNATLSYLM